ncbi:MAG: sterol desaturase family protein [Actinomyces sp.]|nr:MAG: sterol desaturase family protein [Actinomyces sp.]
MSRRRLPLDAVDLASIPYFAVTMWAEARALRDRPHRRPDDVDAWPPERRADTSGPPDPLVPVGYETRDTLASLAMLAGNVAVNLTLAGVYTRINQRLFGRRVANWGRRRGAFWTALLVWDFLYYWNHRWQHEHRIFWANHVTHHSSERYNLSTALRQPWSGFLLAWVFFPMPLLGYTPAQVARAGQLDLLYQYWIHTEAIDRLPRPVEAVFNTPSHHRVHHGTNPQYLDRNHGGILIVWDKLFGTFEPEVRRVRYGLTKNIGTHNPLRIAYHEFVDLARDVARTPGWRDKLRLLWRRPGWQPASAGARR